MANRPDLVQDLGQTQLPQAFFTGKLPPKIILKEVKEGTGTFVRGTIMAEETSTGKITEYKKSGSGGEEKARYILAAETLDLATDKNTSVYDFGDFLMPSVIFPVDFEDADKQKAKKELEAFKIYLTETQEVLD